MKSKISRRSFLRNIAAAGSGAAALGLLAGCSSSSTAASSGSTAAAEDKYTPGTYSASKTISYSEIGVSMTFDANSITACEITSSGEQDLLTDDKKTAMAKAIVEGQSTDVDAVTSCTLVASVGAIQECVADCIAQATGTEVEKPETTEVTGRVPGYCGPGDWLGEAPADPDKYEDAGTYDVVIVGGGVSGMYAAVTAAERGHDVTLVEKADKLGGQLWFTEIDTDKESLLRFRDSMIARCKYAGVKILLNTEATKESIEAMHPDYVICSVGAHPFVPPIKGIENAEHALYAYTHPDEIKGKKIIIIGGGAIGCESGYFFASEWALRWTFWRCATTSARTPA